MACALPMLLAAQEPRRHDPKDGWIPLFNGEDLTGWKAREADRPNGWRAVNGVYVNMPPSVDILTERSFDDFDLYVEVKPAERTNSGLYLRDIYEVQILNSHGRPLSENMCGALYRRLAPKVNACRLVDSSTGGHRSPIVRQQSSSGLAPTRPPEVIVKEI